MTIRRNASAVLVEANKYIVEHAKGLLDPGYPHTLMLDSGLKELLGCPYTVKNENGTDIMVRPKADPGMMTDIRQCIPLLLDAIIDHRGHADDVASLLAGLHFAGWRETMLASESNAYTLAAASIYFMEAYDEYSAILFLEVMPAACTILNEWLEPSVPISYAVSPSPRELCRLMFGDAWCDFVLTNVKWREVVSFVRQSRPPFVPGLCPLQDAELELRADESLPDLGMEG